MLKGEIEILISVAQSKRTFKQIASSRIALSNTYIISTIDSLVHRGYIINNKPIGYQLTTKGVQASLEFLPKNGTSINFARSRLLHEHSAKAKSAIEMIEKLGIEYDVAVEKLQN